MLRLSKRTSTLVRFSPFALIAAFSACGNSDDTVSGGSGGANGAGGDIGLGSGGAGANPGTGSSPGTGGSASGGASGTGASNGAGGSPNGNSGGSGNAAGGNDGSGGGGGGQFSGVPGAEGYDCAPATGTVPELKLTAVVSQGLNLPMAVAHEPGGSTTRLFVPEIHGTIRIIENGALLPTPFLDISSKVAGELAIGDERGLLGFAFHPDYAQNGLFYVHYSDSADDTGDSVIEEYQVSADRNVATAGSGRVLFKVDQIIHELYNLPFTNHKGGSISFGADKMLYIGLGDGGGANDPEGNGQNLTTMLGKILRVNPLKSGQDAYSIPAGNLKDTVPAALPEIWDYGMRNPFRSSFDGCTGDFYIGDVGQDAWEEVDIEKAGEGGKNYGWNTMEGTHCFSPMNGCTQTGITLPQIEFANGGGESITGGSVYRGSAIPALRGAYVYAEYSTGKVWYTFFDRNAGTTSTPRSVGAELGVTGVVSIANGADGELYFVTLGATGTSAVYKLGSVQ